MSTGRYHPSTCVRIRAHARKSVPAGTWYSSSTSGGRTIVQVATLGWSSVDRAWIVILGLVGVRLLFTTVIATTIVRWQGPSLRGPRPSYGISTACPGASSVLIGETA